MTVLTSLDAAPALVDGNEVTVVVLPSGGTPNRKRTWASLLTYFLSQAMRDKLAGLADSATDAATADAYFRARGNHTGTQAIGTVTDLQATLDAKIGTALPGTATPANNGDIAIELTSNTSLTIKVKGSDGTVRSAVLPLS